MRTQYELLNVKVKKLVKESKTELDELLGTKLSEKFDEKKLYCEY